MKKILIGTHNKGKFKEISYLLPKKVKKISPIKLNISSPEETGKTWSKTVAGVGVLNCVMSRMTSPV